MKTQDLINIILKLTGTIDFIHGSRAFLNKSIYNHQPKVADMILFPNYLMHTAYPFQSGEGAKIVLI